MAELAPDSEATLAEVNAPADTEMGDGEEDKLAEAVAEGEDGMDFDIVETPARVSFLEYLKSPIVELVVGSGDQQALINAHEDLLTQSSYFEKACADLTGPKKRLELPEDDPEAMGSFIEYLYRGDYFPRSIDGALERHPSIPEPDADGAQLLKHAAVYNLAKIFSVPALASLAHTKIQKTTSTARGEIAYARYIYATTEPKDTTVRKPIAAFWATRSHVLRHEAEEEFRAMCLEYPQFGFDVLSIVLDTREKKGGAGGGQSGSGGGPTVNVNTQTPGRGRKRARTSGVPGR